MGNLVLHKLAGSVVLVQANIALLFANTLSA